MATLQQINEFLKADETIAIAGVSRNKKKFSRMVYDEFNIKGYKVVPINPNADEIDGDFCFRTPTSLPPDVKRLLVITNKEATTEVVKQGLDKGLQHIWIQQMSETKEAVDLGGQSDINFISKHCIFMFADPVKGLHKFHRGIQRFFRKYPN